MNINDIFEHTDNGCIVHANKWCPNATDEEYKKYLDKFFEQLQNRAVGVQASSKAHLGEVRYGLANAMMEDSRVVKEIMNQNIELRKLLARTQEERDILIKYIMEEVYHYISEDTIRFKDEDIVFYEDIGVSDNNIINGHLQTTNKLVELAECKDKTDDDNISFFPSYDIDKNRWYIEVTGTIHQENFKKEMILTEAETNYIAEKTINHYFGSKEKWDVFVEEAKQEKEACNELEKE
jgi:hypothetical protein